MIRCRIPLALAEVHGEHRVRLPPIQYSNTVPARFAWKHKASAGGTKSAGLLPLIFPPQKLHPAHEHRSITRLVVKDVLGASPDLEEGGFSLVVGGNRVKNRRFVLVNSRQPALVPQQQLREEAWDAQATQDFVPHSKQVPAETTITPSKR